MDSFQLPCPSPWSGAVGSMAHTFRCLGFHSDSYHCIAGTFNSRCAILRYALEIACFHFQYPAMQPLSMFLLACEAMFCVSGALLQKQSLIPSVCLACSAPYTVCQSVCNLPLAASPSHSRAMSVVPPPIAFTASRFASKAFDALCFLWPQALLP